MGRKGIMKKINSVLGEVSKSIEPDLEEVKKINRLLREIEKGINQSLKSKKIIADLFVGGSFAKKTLIKKEEYDIDIFLRFDKKHKSKNISDLTESVLKAKNKKSFKLSRIHGSRDYFKLRIDKGLFFEIIPVLKVKNPSEAENITDLSYSHVRYINKKVKSQKILNDIKIAKAFCHSNNCYGAESYVKGFSGYSLELLIHKYGSFEKFLKAMIKIKSKKKEIIDIEKHYKNKNTVLLDLNASKLQSPVVLIDPTYKQRNALAGLGQETFERFQKNAKAFLRKPSLKFFEIQKLDFESLKKKSEKKKLDFVVLELKTGKQPGDVAGSKILKFYKHLEKEIGKFFDVKGKGFEYSGEGRIGKVFFSVKRKKEILFTGPGVKQKKHVAAFKQKHRKTFTKKGRIYSKLKLKENVKDFLKGWKKKNGKRMREMSIKGFEIL